MIIYVTPAGKTAAESADFLRRPKEEFDFDAAVLLCSSLMAHRVCPKVSGYSADIVEISNPHVGDGDYESVVRRLVRTVITHDILDRPSDRITRIIVNSSGGTEKMSSIIKDTILALSVKYPVQHVFGTYNADADLLVFTRCPGVNHRAILSEETATVMSIRRGVLL